MKRLIGLFILFVSLNAAAAPKLLDKIVAIVDDKVVTLSEVKRVQEGMEARANISPMIYKDRSKNYLTSYA